MTDTAKTQVARWLRSRSRAFSNDVKFLAEQSPPADHDGDLAWRMSRARLEAFKIAAHELLNVADELDPNA